MNPNEQTFEAGAKLGQGLVILALAATLVAAFYANSSRVNQLHGQTLTGMREDLTSIASESSILADQLSAGRAPGNYTQVSSHRLAQSVAAINDQLDFTQPDANSRQTADQLSGIGHQLRLQLVKLENLPNRDEAAGIKDQLIQLRNQLEATQ